MFFNRVHSPVAYTNPFGVICALNIRAFVVAKARYNHYNKDMMNQCVALETRVSRVIEEHEMISPGERVLVAVSGGADSVALLIILHRLRDAFQMEVEAAHFEHGIRGEASVEDARFVKSLCARLAIPFHFDHADVPSLAKEWKKSIEDAARQARYHFLEYTAASVRASKVALAHQLQDQAETLLLHLVHGCGLAGLSGMRHVNGVFIRPLLDVPRDDLEAYLRAQDIAWHEDATNQDTRYTRNMLRHKVFPLLQSLNPRVCEAMARTASQVSRTVEALQSQAEALLLGRVKRMPYGAFWVVQGIVPTIEACRMFTDWAGVPALDAAQSEALFSLNASQMCNLPAGWRALRTQERLHLLSPTPSITPPVLEEAFSRDDCVPSFMGDGIHTQVFDADALCGVVFRYRCAGDVFAPLGTGSTQKLKKTLQDAGIDRPFRDLLPLLARGNRVLWIVGLKPSRDAAITDRTQKRVQITYHSGLPWEL